MPIASQVRDATARLRRDVAALRFSAPVTHVYNPLEYAGRPHGEYVRRFGATRKRVLFLGMNPGPYGMTQTGIPFGEIAFVRNWLRIQASGKRPEHQHPKRPIEGLECKRSEVSGARLWGAIAEHFETPEAFFADHYIANYCPLVFLEESGRNRTPDKLPEGERRPLMEACDRHLRRLVKVMDPEWIVGIGRFASTQARRTLGETGPRIGEVLHPSPASPLANRGWSAQAQKQLKALGICSSRA